MVILSGPTAVGQPKSSVSCASRPGPDGAGAAVRRSAGAASHHFLSSSFDLLGGATAHSFGELGTRPRPLGRLGGFDLFR